MIITICNGPWILPAAAGIVPPMPTGPSSGTRTSTSRRLHRLIGCATAAVLVAGCSYLGERDTGGGETAEPTRDPNTAPGALQTGWLTARSWIRVDLLALDRTSPKVVTVRFELTNTGDATFHTGDKLGYSGYGVSETDASAVTLVDVEERKRYYPLTATDDKCVCSIPDDGDLEPGESLEFFASYAAPSSESVMVMVPNTPPFLAVPVGDKQGPVKPGEGQPERDAAELELQSPTILPIRAYSKALDGSKEEEENDKEVEVRLSSDVLFAINKANLSPKAQTVLKSVAARIDRSKATVVKVDGYTDDTGNDAINDPLSKRRAAAVRDALTELVTRDGVTYQVAGHGSADPVVSNNSDENRKRNRRVSVTFAR